MYHGESIILLEGAARITRKSGDPADTAPVSFRADWLEWNVETNEISAIPKQD